MPASSAWPPLLPGSHLFLALRLLQRLFERRPFIEQALHMLGEEAALLLGGTRRLLHLQGGSGRGRVDAASPHTIEQLVSAEQAREEHRRRADQAMGAYGSPKSVGWGQVLDSR